MYLVRLATLDDATINLRFEEIKTGISKLRRNLIRPI